MADELLAKAIVTIRTVDGREIDLTDSRAARVRLAASGRMVLSSREVQVLRQVPREHVESLLAIRGVVDGELTEIGPSSGPYPWDGVDVSRAPVVVTKSEERPVVEHGQGKQGRLW